VYSRVVPSGTAGSAKVHTEEVLGTSLRDTVKARRLRLDGTYEGAEARGEPVHSQQACLDAARRAAEAPARPPVLRQVRAPGPGRAPEPASRPNGAAVDGSL
jgi:hypothetical protein